MVEGARCPSSGAVVTSVEDRAWVQIRGLDKRFGDLHALRHLDLDIGRGELVSLLGPSGCGKTTTLRLIAGFETPDAGTATLGGRPIFAEPAHRRGMGVVFQNYALFPHLSAADNVAFGPRIARRPKAEIAARVDGLLALVGLPESRDKFPDEMSGGQQQRIALARALVFEPKLVLMDEPLGALDKQLREHMQYELKSLHEKLGVTFVYVTHDQGEALTMSDRVAVFDKGIVQQLDTVDSLYESPCNEFVANFIGDSNRLRGTVANVDGDYCEFHLIDGTRLVGRNIGGAEAGAQGIACIRPERMKLAAGASKPGANALAGEARGLIYFGDHVRMRCGLPQQDECFVKVPLGTDALDGFAPGVPIALEFAPEHLRVFA